MPSANICYMKYVVFRVAGYIRMQLSILKNIIHNLNLTKCVNTAYFIVEQAMVQTMNC